MKTVATIIELFGGPEALRQNPIRLENPPYMRLVIEYIGGRARGMPAISVAHYGDLMRDPEIVFEVSPTTRTRGRMDVRRSATAVGGVTLGLQAGKLS